LEETVKPLDRELVDSELVNTMLLEREVVGVGTRALD
jgi:hypothetical protein